MAGNKGFIVQSRDLTLLRALAVLLVADCEQIKVVAGFGSTTRANTRLLQLVRAGLLRRFFLGSGGGRKALYALSVKGAQLAGVPRRGPRRRQDEVLVADFYIAHQLTINNIYCQLKYKSSPDPRVTVHRWISFHQKITPSLSLIPDGYAEFRTPFGAISSFLEVDLGNESSAIWKQKARNYLQLALSGEFQKLFGHQRFRVLVLLNSERRLESIRKSVAAVTEKIFWFATLESVRTNFFAPVWLRPSGDEPKPFLEPTL
jgi:hypothetical protein